MEKYKQMLLFKAVMNSEKYKSKNIVINQKHFEGYVIPTYVASEYNNVNKLDL